MNWKVFALATLLMALTVDAQGSGAHVTTEPEAGIHITTEPEAGIHVTTEPEAGIHVTTEPEAGIHITTEPEAGIHVTTEPEAGIHITTEPETGIRVTTEPEEPEEPVGHFGLRYRVALRFTFLLFGWSDDYWDMSLPKTQLCVAEITRVIKAIAPDIGGFANVSVTSLSPGSVIAHVRITYWSNDPMAGDKVLDALMAPSDDWVVTLSDTPSPPGNKRRMYCSVCEKSDFAECLANQEVVRCKKNQNACMYQYDFRNGRQSLRMECTRASKCAKKHRKNCRQCRRHFGPDMDAKCTFCCRGRHCSRKVPDACFLQPCQNGGSCVAQGQGQFKCQCAEGFEGETCEERTDC